MKKETKIYLKYDKDETLVQFAVKTNIKYKKGFDIGKELHKIVIKFLEEHEYTI